jgi:hypothetical protein
VTFSLLKMTWGFLLLGIIGYLAHAFAVGTVEEKTSFGLPVLLGALVLMADRFAAWAFRVNHGKETPEMESYIVQGAGFRQECQQTESRNGVSDAKVP